MSLPTDQAAADLAEAPDGAKPGSPRADLHDAIGWIVLGIAVVIASWRMDRLANQHINPLTVPGLVPGLLGLSMVLVGAILGLRSHARGAFRDAIALPGALRRLQRKRVVLAALLCCGYSVILIGRGLPFWIASSIYITVSILVFDRIGADPVRHRIGLPAIGRALLIGVLSSITVWQVFERLFLVRLP